MMTSAGLEAVFLANRDKLVRFLRASGASDAEDILHDLWLKIASARHGPIATPLPYLFRAAHNLMLDRYRSTQTAAARDQAWYDLPAETDGNRLGEPDAERILIAREEARRADAALQSVGDRAAHIFRRHRLDGVEQRQVAAELGISLSTVESDLRKAYAVLVELKRRIDEA